MDGCSRHLEMGAGAVVCIGGSVILWGIHSEMTAVVSGLTVALSGMYGWGTLSNAFPTKRIKGEWHTPIEVKPKEQPASHVQQAIDAIYGAYRPVVEAYEKEIKGPMQKDSQSEELNGQQAEAKMLDRYIRRTLRFPLAIHYKRVIKTPLHFLYRIDPVADAPYNIDLFWVTPESWGLQFFIRTGPADYVAAALAYWKKITNGGFSNGGILHLPDATIVPTPEEEDVFRVLEERGGKPCRFTPPERRFKKH